MRWKIIEKEEEMTLHEEDQPSLWSLVTSAIFHNVTLQRLNILPFPEVSGTTTSCIFKWLQNQINLLKEK